MGSPKVAAVIVNWNGAQDTIDCLQSLRASTVRPVAIVVDNASTDGSPERIDASGSADVLIRNTENRGFAGGNNIGLRRALDEGFDILIVVNNDTVADRAMVELLVDAVGTTDGPCAISPTISYYGSEDLWFAGGLVDNGHPRHLFDHEMPPAPEQLYASELLSGCCVAATAETWRRVGLFDERYFLIFEDSDWSLRAAQAGVALFVHRDARLAHRVSRSFREGAASLLGQYYFARNGLLFRWDWRRRTIPAFFLAQILRPTLRAFRRRHGRRASLFGLIGTASFAVSGRGRASAPLEALATRLRAWR